MASRSIKDSIDTLDLNNPPVFFSYKDHFRKLWDFHSIENIPESTILIEWDGFPDKTQNFLVETDKYITPIDWAVGYSLYINSKCKESRAYPDLRILIYDNGPDKVSHSDSVKFVYQSSNMDIMSMPWIRIFSLKVPVSSRNSTALIRLLKNLDSDDEKSKNSHQDSSYSTSMSAVFTNIRRLVNSFRGNVGARELSLVNQTTQTPNAEHNTEICDEPLPTMKEVFNNKKGLDLNSIKGIWATSITRPSTPGDHHAIANLVGPLLLTEEKDGDLHVNALQALMRSIGLLPDHKEWNASKENSENAKAQLGIGNSWIDWKNPEWKYKLEGLLSKSSDKLNLILIDDMFQSSWGKILCRAVGVDYKKPSGGDGKDQLVKISNWNVIGKDEKVVVKASSSAAWIIKKLEGFDGEDKRFDLSLDDDGVGQEILFLDLRLYPGNLETDETDETDETEIKKFFEPLLTLAEKFIEGQAENLPWNGFAVGNKEGEKGEIERIKDWIKSDNKKQEDSGYIEALTLLPRILALTDLSLPIVLFSSTGRRDITEMLKHYGNIITVFEKPRFTVDIPIDIAYQTKCKFLDAMKEAFTVLAGRQICRKVEELKKRAESSAAMIPVETNIPKFKHIEIYIDESGTPKNYTPESFCVGGLIMAYPQYNDVDQLSNRLKKTGCYWYSNDEKDRNYLLKRPGEKNRAYDNPSWTYDETRGKLLELCKDRNVFISGICVQEKMEDIKAKQTIHGEERHVLLKDEQGDERYKRLLTQLLTLALYEYIPEMIGKKQGKKGGITLSVFAGTRTVPIDIRPIGMFKNHDPDDYFGYGYNPKIKSYYTIGANSIHPLVARILKNREDLCNEVTLHHARGISLKYGVVTKPDKRKREKYYVRNQHYFADNVLNRGGINDVYKDEFEIGYSTQSNMDMDTLLDARKELLDDNIAEGIIQMAEYTGAEVKDKMSDHLIRKIGESLKPEHFEGFHFLNILEISKTGQILAVNSSSTPDPEKKQPTDKSKVHEETLKLNDDAEKIKKPQTPEKTSTDLAKPKKTVTEDNKLKITVIVIKKRKKNLKVRDYVCEETSGEKRRILVEQFAKKASDISVMAIGAIFEVTTYERDGILYGADLRQIDNNG